MATESKWWVAKSSAGAAIGERIKTNRRMQYFRWWRFFFSPSNRLCVCFVSFLFHFIDYFRHFYSVFIGSALHFQVSAMDSGFFYIFPKWFLFSLFRLAGVVYMASSSPFRFQMHCDDVFPQFLSLRAFFVVVFIRIFAVVARCSSLLWLLLLLFLWSPVFVCVVCALRWQENEPETTSMSERREGGERTYMMIK